ncbi:interleukin-9 receptor isoform X2 [Tamandua tetradactyla]|uniref:interleukin-9 receptor isoform X2 n=1 Tax=Tamandua tetradactyla TaxID=48850 RepID=UPI004054705E
MGAGRRVWGGLAAGAFTCFTNNILRFDCRWSASELGLGTGPWLLFTSNQEPGSRHRCVFRAGACSVELPPEEVLLPSDSFTITFHHRASGKEQVLLVDHQFLPRRHVKLDPPFDLQSNVTSDSCILTWSVSPALEPLQALLDYELVFRRQGQAWERARCKDHIVGVTRLRLEATELDPGCTYEARLRVQMAAQEVGAAEEEEERYAGQWSEWSRPTSFLSPRRLGLLPPPWAGLDSLVALSALLLLTSLTCLLFTLSPSTRSRVKRTFCQSVPSPASFFQSLYGVHSGDFQTWAGTCHAALQPSQGGDSPWPEALESNFGEAVSPLTLATYSAAQPWRPLGLEQGEDPGQGLPGGPPVPSSEDKLPAGTTEHGAQVSAYLPQEDWALGYPLRPIPPDPEGGSSDYCTLGCDLGPPVRVGDHQSGEYLEA